MLAHLADVSIRSLALALVAAAILWGRRPAALQHAVWTVVVCGMLILLAFGQALPRMPLHIGVRTAVEGTAGSAVVDGVHGVPTPVERRPNPAGAPRRAIDRSLWVVFAYGMVACGFLVRFVTGMWLAGRLRSAATPLPCGGYESQRIVVPMTVGWLRPRVLLPAEWRDWDAAKLDAVLAHEGAHVRRRDNLVAAVASLNRCAFWFHPLSWILERRLTLLAEQACDEASVAELGDRRGYAQLLLEMAAVVDDSRGRLRGHALTMAAPSHLRRRIDAVLQEGRTFSLGLSRRGWGAVVAGGVAMVAAAGAVQVDRRPPQVAAPQARTAAAPKFDVASIKPCNPAEVGGKKSGGRGGGRGFSTSPGRLALTCMTVLELMTDAYVTFPTDAPVNASMFDERLIRGGPAWVRSDRFTIEAKSGDPAANGPADGRGPVARLLRGPMLQALLEERFQLQVHRETEDVPMYGLTAAKGGFKLKPMEAGGCIPPNPTGGVRVGEMFPANGKPLCVSHVGMDGPNWTLDAAGTTVGQLAKALGQMLLDRPVLDQTGIAGEFIFHLKFARDASAPGKLPGGMEPPPIDGADIPAGPSVFTELEQKVGLKLAPEKGPRGFIVIDRIERPSEN